MPYGVASKLAQLKIAALLPAASPGRFDILNIRKVGVLTIDGVTVRIQPKTPIRRLLGMLVHSRDPDAIWRDDDVAMDSDDDLYATVAHAFARTLHRSLAAGLQRGYIERDEALPLVRGRWRITDQLSIRAGQPLPLEVTYDDFVEDIALNRVLATAVRRLLRFPGLPSEAGLMLRQDLRAFADVPSVAWGSPLPYVALTRGSERFRLPLELARIILNNLSLEHRDGAVVGSGFLVDVWSIFEDFVGAVVRRLAAPGVVRTQHQAKLDLAGRIDIKPDLVWLDQGAVVSCADIKYKVEHGGRVPNADLYQLISYCGRFGLAEGHLVYAEADDPTDRIEILGGPVIQRHALRLDRPLADVEKEIAEIASRIRPVARVGSSAALP